MNLLQFLFGKNFKDKELSLKPGAFYLDTENHELWYDDPSSDSTEHNKVVDTATLIYEITGTVTFPSGGANSSTVTAKLGTAVLGSMVLGQE